MKKNFLPEKAQRNFEEITDRLFLMDLNLDLSLKASPDRQPGEYQSHQVLSYKNLTSFYLGIVKNIFAQIKPYLAALLISELEKLGHKPAVNGSLFAEIFNSAQAFFASDFFMEAKTICPECKEDENLNVARKYFQMDLFMQESFPKINQEITIKDGESTLAKSLSYVPSPHPWITDMLRKLIRKKDFAKSLEGAMDPERRNDQKGRVFNNCMGGPDREEIIFSSIDMLMEYLTMETNRSKRIAIHSEKTIRLIKENWALIKEGILNERMATEKKLIENDSLLIVCHKIFEEEMGQHEFHILLSKWYEYGDLKTHEVRSRLVIAFDMGNSLADVVKRKNSQNAAMEAPDNNLYHAFGRETPATSVSINRQGNSPPNGAINAWKAGLIGCGVGAAMFGSAAAVLAAKTTLFSTLSIAIGLVTAVGTVLLPVLATLAGLLLVGLAAIAIHFIVKNYKKEPLDPLNLLTTEAEDLQPKGRSQSVFTRAPGDRHQEVYGRPVF